MERKELNPGGPVIPADDQAASLQTSRSPETIPPTEAPRKPSEIARFAFEMGLAMIAPGIAVPTRKRGPR